ncbi:hypothetical protein J6590_077847 [Homalodisca vitripennis]|nr:hypothetical protein J6590_077847 [Homalodisca vitripennis]
MLDSNYYQQVRCEIRLGLPVPLPLQSLPPCTSPWGMEPRFHYLLSRATELTLSTSALPDIPMPAGGNEPITGAGVTARRAARCRTLQHRKSGLDTVTATAVAARRQGHTRTRLVTYIELQRAPFVSPPVIALVAAIT